MKHFLSYLLIFLTFHSSIAFGVPTSHKGSDKIQWGRTDANPKVFEALNGLGGSNPTLIADPVADDWNMNKSLDVTGSLDTTSSVDAGTTISSGGDADINGNAITLGNGATSDKTMTFDIGAGANNPLLRWLDSAGKLQFCDGGVSTCFSFDDLANKTLSNLTSPTSINQDLIPDGDGTRDVGSAVNRWDDFHGQQLVLSGTINPILNMGSVAGQFTFNVAGAFGDTVQGALQTQAGPNIGLVGQLLSSTSGTGHNAFVEGGKLTNAANSDNAGSVFIGSGSTVGAGNSGDITARIASSTGGAKGSIKLQDGSEGNIGEVWTSKGVVGEGNWEPATGGTGGGAFSIITGDNSDFESTVGDWLAYDDGAVATPTDDATGGTGGSPTVISIARNTTAANLLNGTAVGLISKTAADGQGEGVSLSNLTVPDFFRGRTMQVRIKYKTLTGYVNNYYRVFGIAQDGAQAGIINVLNNAGGDGSLSTTPSSGLEFIGSVVMPSDATQVRLVVHGTTTDATAFDVSIDDVKWEEISGVNGAVISEWEDFTPTFNNVTLGSGAVTVGKFRQVGDSAEITAQFVMGTTASATGTITLDMPIGLTIDTSKLTSNNSNATFGVGRAFDNNLSDTYIGVITKNSTLNSIRINGPETQNAWGVTVPFTWADSDSLTVTFTVPITEFDAGAIISTAQANVTVPKLNAPVTGTQTGITGAATVVEFAAADIDNFSGFDAGNNRYEIPSDGDYFVHMNLRTANLAADGRITLAIRKNTSLFVANESGGGNINIGGSVSGFETFVAGDLIDVTVDSLDTSWDVLAGDLTIFRVPDFTIFGVNGVTEYIEAEMTVQTITTLVDTETDVIGSTIALTAGTWQIGYNVSMLLNEQGGIAQGVFATVAVFDTANNRVNPTVAIVGGEINANKNQTFSISRQTEITITQNTSFKLRIRCNLATVGGESRLLNQSVLAGFTDPDNNSIIYARRIK